MSEKKIAQKGPYVMDMEPGKYWFCACGHSADQPFCDGSHKPTEFRPIEVNILEKKQVAWCGCKHSNQQTFCDGTHRNV